MKEKTQLFYIHGGMTFKNHDEYINYLKTRPISIESKKGWAQDYLTKELENKVDIIRPRMPFQDNSKYDEWKIYFERFLDQLKDNIILIGESLGGIFFAKYLSENKFSKKILGVYLVCPPFDDTCIGEDLVNGFELKDDLSLIEKNCSNVKLLFSKDDDCVPVSHADKYRSKLPNSEIIIYESKNGHFNITEFSEIIDMINNDLERV